ncbi:MAG TPA: ABC transporter substrate-binding protein [Trebonia sp.]|nr:ABC transporter substrate-binding protein [Trebonia sp.]
MPSPRARSRSLARRLPAAVALAAAAGLAGCASATAAPPPASGGGATVTVTVVPAPGAAGLYIAADGGLFTQAGLHVTITNTVSAAGTVPDLLSGKTDVVLGQWTTAIAAEAKGTRLAAIGEGNAGGLGLEELVTSPGSPIERLSQLSGKTIAVNALQGLPQLLTVRLLRDNGVPVSRVRFIPVPFPLMGAALARHEVDAAFMVEPYLSRAEEKYGVAELADLDQGSTAGFPVTGYYTTRAWEAANPAAAAAFTAALRRGQETAAADRAAVERALIRHLGISPLVAAVMSPGTYPVGPVDPVHLERVGDLMQAGGLLPRTAQVPAIARALAS